MRTLLPPALLLGLVTGPALAATPSAGTLSPSSPRLTYTAGPFAAPNASPVTSPTCGPAHPCDDFALTLDVPADWRQTHPRDLLFVSARWPINNFEAYGLYVVETATGRILDYKVTELDPVVVSLPAARGSYTIRLVPQQSTAATLDVTVALLADQTGGRAAGPAPRFEAIPTPPHLGNDPGGEANIGYNPFTKRAMFLSYQATFRATFPENFAPPLPECCDALWDEVSSDWSRKNTNDPILVTDPQTGRTFVSQLQGGTPGQSLFVYTDNDGGNVVPAADTEAALCTASFGSSSCGATRGDGWTLSPSTMNGGIDHQSVGVGPYSALGPARPGSAYPNAVYYCSQSIVGAFCIRSDDGGDTFTAPSVLVTAADCDGYTPYIHGHVKVALDGTAYVPERNCGGEQSVIVSENSGETWEVRRVRPDGPQADPTVASSGDNDSSVAVARDGTLYYCYLSGDGHPHVAVSQDKGRTWTRDRDIGYAQGIEHAGFPNAVAGDPDRAACAFLGTRTPGPYQSTAFTGIWHVYVATTYDGGDTWHTVDPLPDDPVQGRRGICLGGTTCIENRNLLDFNEVTMDEQGRVLYGFNDGCLGDCILTGVPTGLPFFIPTFVNVITDIFAPGAVPAEVGFHLNTAAKPTILRQSGGRTLLAAFDALAQPAVPKAACLSGGRDSSLARLVWKVPDNGGADIAGYNVYRGTEAGAETLIASAGPTLFYDDPTANPVVADYYYKVTALNARGEGVASNTVKLTVGTPLPAQPNQPPVAHLAAAPAAGAFPRIVQLDASGTADPDGDAIRSYTFDFGDGSDVVTQAGATIEHAYAAAGTYVASVKATDAKALRSQNAGTATITPVLAPDPFTFVERNNVATGVFVTSEAKTLTGFTGQLPVTVTNGQYSVAGGAYTSANGSIAVGQTLRVRHLSAATVSTATETTIAVGSYSTAFRSVTTSADRTPDPFTFGTTPNVAPATAIESPVVTPAGYDTATSIVAGPGASYRINGTGPYVTTQGTLRPTDSVQVRHVSSATPGGYTKTYVKVGGVTGYFTTRTR